MSINYSEDVERLMNDKLKNWVATIKKDRCFIEGNHDIKWSEIRAEIITFVKHFIFDILRVDGEYVYCEPLGNRKRSINSLIANIDLLLSKFESSPPFTIHYFTKILSIDKELDYFSNYRGKEDYNGLKEYTRKTVDLISKTETSVIVNNVYYEDNGEYTVPSMNKVHAVRYLKLLIKCLNVESSCKDVKNNMNYYKSTNLIVNEDVEKCTELSDDDDSTMKLVKIDW